MPPLCTLYRKELREVKELALGHTVKERWWTSKAHWEADPDDPQQLPSLSLPILVTTVSWHGAWHIVGAQHMNGE